MRTTEKKVEAGFSANQGNGFLLAVMNFAAESYGWTREYILDSSVLFLILLMNEHVRKMSGGKGLSLLDMEDMENDDIPWEERVRRNHEHIAKIISTV